MRGVTEECQPDVIDEPVMVEETLESGQFFNWRKKGDWYETVVEGEKIDVRDSGEGIEYHGSREVVVELMGLDDSVEDIKREIDYDDRVEEAIDRYPGLRVVNAPFFPTVISFIISAQNRIPRIHDLVLDIAENYGSTIEDVAEFPEPRVLADVPETELREMSLGYRAPYVKEASRQIAEEEVNADDIRSMEYIDAHTEIQELMGVGDKVADCILLFSLDFHEAVPLDTWMQKTIERYYPELSADGYVETCENFREKFGEGAGYAQNYLFHYIRHHG
ncbi:MAG: DNA-3-methyladenine glycosylase [Halobacteria archaeon]